MTRDVKMNGQEVLKILGEHVLRTQVRDGRKYYVTWEIEIGFRNDIKDVEFTLHLIPSEERN